MSCNKFQCWYGSENISSYELPYVLNPSTVGYTEYYLKKYVLLLKQCYRYLAVPG